MRQRAGDIPWSVVLRAANMNYYKVYIAPVVVYASLLSPPSGAVVQEETVALQRLLRFPHKALPAGAGRAIADGVCGACERCRLLAVPPWPTRWRAVACGTFICIPASFDDALSTHVA